MPSDQSTWLVAVPSDGDAEGLLPEITHKLAGSQTALAEFAIPAFKVRPPSCAQPTHSQPADRHARRPHHPVRGAPQAGRVLHRHRRQDRRHPPQPPQQRPRKACAAPPRERAQRRRLHPQRLAMESRQIRRAEKPAGDSRCPQQGNITRLHPTPPHPIHLMAACQSRVQDMASIDNMMKSKLNNYNLVKGSLVQMQRKKTCVDASPHSPAPSLTLAVQGQSLRAVACRYRGERSHDTGLRVHADLSGGSTKVRFRDCIRARHLLRIAHLVRSERTLTKEWNTKYERLTGMVVPRSSS